MVSKVLDIQPPHWFYFFNNFLFVAMVALLGKCEWGEVLQNVQELILGKGRAYDSMYGEGMEWKLWDILN